MRELVEMLFEGVKENDLKKVAIALIKGAKANAYDYKGMTPLHYAESVEIAELLISAGANVNARVFMVGRTPLHVASYTHNYAVANTLIGAGANVNAKDNYGRSIDDV